MAYERTTWENGITPINAANLNNIEEGIVAVDEALPTKTEIVKLWENGSPTSSFASQNISLDLSEYDRVEVELRLTASRNDVASCEFSANGYGAGSGCFGDVPALYTRRMSASSDGVYFYAGYYITSGLSTKQENGVAIPYRIYGIKGVQ